MPKEWRSFSGEENATWKLLFERQTPLRSRQIHPIFEKGLQKLGITSERIPELRDVNRRLEALTGFQGVPVEGFENPADFFKLLSEGKFPIGNFIRDRGDLGYTPAPDVFHDLYGHIPFLTDEDYARFSRELGSLGVRFANDSVRTEMLGRYYWFTLEFALVDLPEGRRIFGAGIASSFTECAYALSDKPEVLPFDVERIVAQSFRIDELQARLFCLKSVDELYSSLDVLAHKLTYIPVHEA